MSHLFDLKPGKILGRHYRVVEFLGKGWEGEVYKVEERPTGIIRAAKLFYDRPSQEQNPHILYAKKLYSLRTCPIVIQYLHQDKARVNRQSIDYLVSDFVEGEVLSSFLERQPQKRLLPFEALHLFYALVQGMEHIHSLGEYHGDIHLDNIIVQKKGLGFSVHLIDLMHLGKSNRQRLQQDVYDMVGVFYQILGGEKYYTRLHEDLKKIICGRKRLMISRRFKMASQLRSVLENLNWN